MSLVSVIIPNYNYEKYIAQTILSVTAQSYPNIEVLVVDDGSTDHSRQIIEQEALKDNRVKLITKKNGGLSSARNEGLRHAKGAYIAFLDSDDLWEKDKLKNQLTCFDNKQVDVVYSNYSFLYSGNRIVPVEGAKNNLTFFDFIDSNPVAGSASSIMFKREVFDAVGFFDESLKSTEDLEYWGRIALRGFKFELCSGCDVLIRMHNTSMSTNVSRMNNYNFIVFKRYVLQLKMIDQTDRKELYNLFLKKLQSIRWHARNTFDYKLIAHTYLLGITFKGFAYLLERYNLRNLKYDLIFFLKNIFRSGSKTAEY